MAEASNIPEPESQATTGHTQTRLGLPGLNLPLNWTPCEEYSEDRENDPVSVYSTQGGGKKLFPTALDNTHVEKGYCEVPMTTLREFAMLHIMNSLTDKPGWDEKVFNDEIAEKWKAEAIATEGTDVTQKMMDWVIAELRWRVICFKATGAVFVYNGDVVKSDSAIPATLKSALRNAVKPIEDVPDTYKDYHPGSDGQVLDLVHPSLFPLMYGRSRVLQDAVIGLADCIENIGKGETITIRPKSEMQLDQEDVEIKLGSWGNSDHNPYSQDFQWLPCEVDISTNQAKVTSYINNLHPQRHQGLYDIISQIVHKTIPLWNMTLSGLFNSEPLKRIIYSLSFDPDPDDMAEEDKPQQRDSETEDDYGDRIMEWEDETRKAVPCDAEDFQPPEDKEYGSGSLFSVDLVRDFAARGLQVIVKLATIELTPEKPEYKGGSWHVEGQLNEHICATALYYYSNDNISDSYLSFRQHVSEEETQDIGYPQNVHGWLSEIFGCEQEGPTVQEVGSVLCKEDRLLTFPNILQHKVQPFSLADPARPGHRKILALFLVDPNIRIISTANVPPQQREWWSERVNEAFANKERALGKLSNELLDKVYEAVDEFPIGMEDAKEKRLELMEERKYWGAEAGDKFLETAFNLCEH